MDACDFCGEPRFTKCSKCGAVVCQDCFKPHPVYVQDSLCHPAERNGAVHARRGLGGCYEKDRATFR